MHHRRICHVIRANHRATVLHHLFTFDTEATRTRVASGVEEQTLRLGVVEYWRPARRGSPERTQYCQFAQASDFWSFVLTTLPRRSVGTLLAHNAAYDCRLVDAFHQLPRLGWELVTLILDSPPFLLEWREGCAECAEYRVSHGISGSGRCPAAHCGGAHRTIRVWDTTNIAPVPLNALARTIGDRKYDMPDPACCQRCWYRYCKQDVVVLSKWFRAYVAWLSAHDLGKLCPTIAGQAWHAYLHRFYAHPIWIHTNAEVIALERAGYFGGRVECFRLGDLSGPDWYALDINSLYPSVMACTPMPTKLLTTAVSPSVERLAHWLERYAVVATVTLHTETPCYPYRWHSRLLFPTGTFTTTLCTPELRRALAEGAITSVEYAAVYEQDVLFREYVTCLYALRQQCKSAGDTVGDFVAKLLLNALYGKFGQLSPTWALVGTCAPETTRVDREWRAATREWVTTRYLAGRVERKEAGSEHSESFPAVAGHVTSAGRARMWTLVEQAGVEHVAYTDTDSLIVTRDGYERLETEIDPARLGALKLEGVSPDLVITGPKQYQFGEKARHKGISKTAVRLPDGGYRQQQWRSLRWGIEHGVIDRVRLETVTKHLATDYQKGVLLSTGVVRPFRFAPGGAGPA